MKKLSLLLGMLPLATWAHAELHRLNFFPQAKSYVDLSYRYHFVEIDTPQMSVQTKVVRNYENSLNVAAAHRFNDSFIGLSIEYESASENAVTHGISTRDRFATNGLTEPTLFSIWRLRPQTADHGLIDLALSYTQKLGAKEIGREGGNRLNGKNLLRMALSHGVLEEKWEFRSLLEYLHYGKGEEYNNFNSERLRVDSYNDFSFRFGAQYHWEDWAIPYAQIGITYHGTQRSNVDSGDNREIQAGTGSFFELGFKHLLDENSLLRARLTHLRHEYFVKGSGSNLEGIKTIRGTSLSYLRAF